MIGAPERRRRLNVPEFDEAGDSKETTIPTALVRAIAADAYRLPYEALRRAVLFLDVDRTEPAAWSALLKVLEEPPTRTRFLLTATRPRLLPSTILSRVVVRPLPGTARDETVATLVSRGLSREEAIARASFRPGDVDDAASLDLAQARSERDELLAAASGVFLTRSVSWALVLSSLLAGEDSTDTADRLARLALLLRDAVAATSSPEGESVVHRERLKDLARLGKAGAADLLDAASAALELAADIADTRRNTRLTAEVFALSLVNG
jgi:hypothetical protein